jgi:hypothetical protein
MLFINHSETLRMFGPRYKPHSNTKVCHRAFARKAIEAHGHQVMVAAFGDQLKNLRAVMGSASFYELGKIRSDQVGLLFNPSSNAEH